MSLRAKHFCVKRASVNRGYEPLSHSAEKAVTTSTKPYGKAACLVTIVEISQNISLPPDFRTVK